MLTKQSNFWSPRSYQEKGVVLMIKQACAGLLWKPGRGKTSVVYAAVSMLLQQNFIRGVLVVCPIRPAYRVWPNQKNDYKDFEHLRVSVLHGPEKDKVLAAGGANIYVVNPEGLPWLLGNPQNAKRIMDLCDMLVIDESTKFANPQTARFKLLRQWIPKFRRRYILTGSPRPKSLMDLFGQIYILDEGSSLGRYITHYRTNYFYPHGFQNREWAPQEGAEERIMEKIAPLVDVINTEEGLGLPDLVFNDIWVDLPPAAMREYRRMEISMLAEVSSGTVVAANAAVASGKCRQICNGILIHEDCSYTEVHDEKLDALRDLIEQLQGHPLLVTYEFVADKNRIEKALNIPCISSGSARKDDEMIEAFSKGLLPAVQGHPQSISLGIDGLQKSCADIAMFGLTWSLLNYEQVIQRVRRSGSKSKTVTVHRILARGTVDERVLQVLDNREKDQDSFLTLLRQMASNSR
jgi:hypothetical protein